MHHQHLKPQRKKTKRERKENKREREREREGGKGFCFVSLAMENHKVVEEEEEDDEVGSLNGEEEEEEDDHEHDDGEVGSTLTMERVAAAKKFIESHYKSQMKHIEERKERRSVLQKKLESSHVPEEEQINLLKDLERKETEYIRLIRHKFCVDDFDLLTIIGRGAFGEVRLCREKKSGNVYAMKKLKKSEMLSRGQVEHVRAERNVLAEVACDCIVKLLLFSR
ncbi:hypothetical protein RIF29_24892 [Crotalaria pallida]|uniref:non-specific serine/threonine protein kinase n=1 Tax=Crotalaria pallida TaxID=3830 RepID=A0AAN9EKK8_CROPI